jgi:hypothetical protein
MRHAFALAALLMPSSGVAYGQEASQRPAWGVFYVVTKTS